MAKGPKYNLAQITQKMEKIIDAKIDHMSEYEPDIIVDLGFFLIYRGSVKLLRSLRQAYLDAGWRKVEIITEIQGQRDNVPVLGIKLSAR